MDRPIMTPKWVADRHRNAMGSRHFHDVRHWGHASEVLYGLEVPVDVVYVDSRGSPVARYHCYWRGRWVATYNPGVGILRIYLLDLLERAIELMTPMERMRHKEKLPNIDLVPTLKRK